MSRFTISIAGKRISRIKRVPHGEPHMVFEGWDGAARTFFPREAKGYCTTLRRYGYEPVVEPAQ
jgi:hypothetical protein